MVGVANYEGQLGECYLNRAIGYEYLKEEMLNHAWEELLEQIDEKKFKSLCQQSRPSFYCHPSKTWL